MKPIPDIFHPKLKIITLKNVRRAQVATSYLVQLMCLAGQRGTPHSQLTTSGSCFYSILLDFILFYSILFYYVILYHILFYFILFYSILFWRHWHCTVLLQYCIVQFCSLYSNISITCFEHKITIIFSLNPFKKISTPFTY